MVTGWTPDGWAGIGDYVKIKTNVFTPTDEREGYIMGINLAIDSEGKCDASLDLENGKEELGFGCTVRLSEIKSIEIIKESVLRKKHPYYLRINPEKFRHYIAKIPATEQEFALGCGLPLSVIEKYISDGRIPWSMANYLADAMYVPVEYFLEDTKTVPEEDMKPGPELVQAEGDRHE